MGDKKKLKFLFIVSSHNVVNIVSYVGIVLSHTIDSNNGTLLSTIAKGRTFAHPNSSSLKRHNVVINVGCSFATWVTQRHKQCIDATTICCWCAILFVSRYLTDANTYLKTKKKQCLIAAGRSHASQPPVERWRTDHNLYFEVKQKQSDQLCKHLNSKQYFNLN